MPEEAVMSAPDTGAESVEPIETNLSEPTDTGADTSGAQVDSHDEPQADEVGNLRGSELYRAVKNKLKNNTKNKIKKQICKPILL